MGMFRPIHALWAAAFCLSAAALFLTFHDFPPGLDASIHEAIGAALAKETLGLYKEGAKIVAIRRDTQAFPQPACDVQFKSFSKALSRGGAAIASVKVIQLDPLRAGEVGPGDFFSLLKKAPPGTILVSFLGPPLLSGEQRRALGPVSAKVVAFCSGSLAERIDFKSLFDSQLLHAAVIARVHFPASVKPGKPPAAFDDLYFSVNQSSLGILAKELASP